MDEYKNTKAHHIQKVNEWQMQKIGKVFSETIKKYQVSVQTCAEVVDLSEYGIQKGECLSKKDLETLLGRLEDWEIDDYKREACRCILTKDIGAYNSCLHLCKYCYATYNEIEVNSNFNNHNPNSSLLIGELKDDDIIKARYK